ncbi:MAG: 2-hydroxyacyl-CoA dehydratase subunit D [Candidatus Bathyarchaeia archaeon]
MIKEEYNEAHQAKRAGKFICWYLAVAPYEIIFAWEEGNSVKSLNIDQFCAMLAAKQVSPKYIEAFERTGFSNDACGYCSIPVGAALRRREGDIDFPLGGMPDPDIILGSTYCEQYPRAIELTSRVLKVPFFILDATHNAKGVNPESLNDHEIEYYVSQAWNFIHLMEKLTGTSFDEDALKTVVDREMKSFDLLREINEYRKAVPSPMTSPDWFACFYPFIILAGKQKSLDFYQELLDEVKARVKDGVGALSDERYRLMWDGLPCYFDLGLFNYIEEKWKAALVFEPMYNYYLGYGNQDSSKPLECLARKNIACTWSMPLDKLKDHYINYIKEYKIDGIIVNHHRRCKIWHVGKTMLSHILYDELGVPSLLVEGEYLDPRDYNRARITMKIDAFMESLSSRNTSYPRLNP